jgi:Domain of unknown function (DUF1707)
MTESGHELAAGAGGGYRPPASSVEREHVIRILGVALAQGRLTEDEHAERVAQASASQSRAGLAALTGDLPAGLLARPPKAGDVRTGVGVIIAAAGVVAAVLVWQPDNALAFLAFCLAAVALLVAPVITVGLMVDVRHQKRSGRQLPPHGADLGRGGGHRHDLSALIDQLPGQERDVLAPADDPAAPGEPPRMRRAQELHVQVEGGPELAATERGD